jgi:hypothetical protein
MKEDPSFLNKFLINSLSFNFYYTQINFHIENDKLITTVYRQKQDSPFVFELLSSTHLLITRYSKHFSFSL